ncbi:MAG: hypothetical protein JWM27_3284 [Gemmatimonadetes bacterium]|nr:hypothetical protein [Gemmatimonadota bacterium]
MKLAPLAVALAAVLPAGACAQTRPAAPTYHAVAPGAAEVRPRAVRESTDTLQMVMEKDGVVLPVAQLVIETSLARSAAGGAVVHRVEATRSRMVPSTVDSFQLAAATLAPVSQRTHEDRVVALDFDGAAIRGTIAEGEMAGPVEITLPIAVWYDNAMDLLLGALPLADGYTASLPTYDDVAAAVVWRDVRVAGTEKVPGDGEMVDAWRVETTRKGRASTYWIEKSSGRMMRWAQPLASGAQMRIVR